MYAVWRWNHKFSSRGKNLILGRRKRIKFRHTANMIRNPSTSKTRPEPREVQTLNLRVFNSASRWLTCCEYLGSGLEAKGKYHPYANIPQWSPCQQMCHTSLRPVNSLLYHGSPLDMMNNHTKRGYHKTSCPTRITGKEIDRRLKSDKSRTIKGLDLV